MRNRESRWLIVVTVIIFLVIIVKTDGLPWFSRIVCFSTK